MAALKYRDEHNKVGYLEKPKGSDDYHQVLDFLRGSHLRYALTHDPIIFDSLVKQFWSTASLRAPELGPPAILATIDRTPYTITEDTVRSQLQLGDDGGIEDLPIADIYLGMDNLGYPTEGKLTFHKNKFSPQWRFLVHTIQHCLSTKSGSWDQFGSPLAIALICLSDGRRFNWSSYIFKGMVNNISNAKRFLMYPRFLQIILGIETRNTKQYHVLKLSSKLFANMRLNFEGDHMPLLAAMLPPAQAAIADEGTGEAAPDVPHTIPKTIQETRPEPDQSQEHLPTPPRPTTSDRIPPVFEQGHTSDPNIASFSGAHESDPDLFTSTNVEDETLGGSFHTTPPRSTQVPPAVSELVQKVSNLESEFQAHKLLFKEVVGTLVKKVKALELKLHTRSRKVVNIVGKAIRLLSYSFFFKLDQEQLFAEFNVFAARNLSLSSEVRMPVEYNILEKRKWRSLAEEKDTQLRARVSSLEAIKGSLRGKVASVKGYNDLLEQERSVLRLQVASLESTVAEKDRELFDLEISSSSLMSQNQGLVSQVHELETSSARLREQLDLYKGNMKRLEEFQDNLMRPLETRLAEIDADFTRCCMRFQESFHPHLLNVVAGRRWLLTHGMKLLMAKCLNLTEYMEALGKAFGRAIEKGMQEGLAAGIEHGQAGRCLTDLEAYIPSAEVDFNSVVYDLRGLNFLLLQELSNKKDASTWDVMNLLRLDDVVVEALGMTGLQPDVNQLMVPVHHKQDMVVIGSQALSVALDICRRRVEKMERNLVERLPFLNDVFVSLDHPLSAEALIEPPVVVPTTNALSTMFIIPHFGPFISVEDYENPDLVDVVPKNVTLGPEGEENIDASTGGDLAFSKLDDEARDVVL
ncbi:hypothetical protein Tco_0636171 [Tanacetum coccineum]